MAQHHTILVVDDDKNFASMICRALEQEPYTVLTASNADEALRLIASNDIHLVMSDYVMPEINGLEFLLKIRSLYPKIITMMVTSFPETDVIIRAISDAGVSRFLLKPLSVNQLRIDIRHALRHFYHGNRDKYVMNGHMETCKSSIAELERHHPGITKVQRDADGYCVLTL